MNRIFSSIPGVCRLLTILLAGLTAMHAAGTPQVSAGGSFTVIAREEGFLWKAGNANGFTQGETSGLVAGKTWERLEAGTNFFLSIDDGQLWAWGSNEYGQFGNGAITGSSSPVRIGTDSAWVEVSAGSEHSLGIKNDGTLWGWGRPYYGYEFVAESKTPLQIGAGFTWKAVFAGSLHDLAIREDGSLWAWGYNSHGHLGNGTNTNSKVPVRVGSGNDWVSASTTNHGSFGLKSDGTLWAWGSNGGTFGNGPDATASSNVPVQVGTDNDWSKISSASEFAVAIKEDGSLWSWGSSFAALGLGDLTRAWVPTRVGTGNAWKDLSTGFYHVVAVQNDGSLWAWGSNNDRQLGLEGTGLWRTPENISSLFAAVPILKVVSAYSVPRFQFADTFLGRIVSKKVDLVNEGLVPVVFSGISTSAGFRIEAAPAQISPLSGLQLDLRIPADTVGMLTGTCVISSNDPANPLITLELEGRVVSPDNDYDQDGLNDAAEVALAPLGFLWNSGQADMVERFLLKAGSAGLHRAEGVLDLRVRGKAPVAGLPVGVLEIPLELWQADSSVVVPMEAAAGSPEQATKVLIPVPSGKDFIRLR